MGEAANPSAVSYTEHMTLLDLMIAVGGLTEFADGNNAKLVRVVEGQQKTYNIDIDINCMLLSLKTLTCCLEIS